MLLQSQRSPRLARSKILSFINMTTEAGIEDLTSAHDRIQQIEPDVETIRQLSGIAGVSVGILHRGKRLYSRHFGFQDIKAQKVANDDTIYGIGSCSKTFFASVIAAFVAEGRLRWDVPVKTYLPEMETCSVQVTDHATLIDLLAHRTGITGPFHLTFQGDGDHLISKQDFWTYMKKLKPAASFRGKWIYNSHGYAIAGELIEKVSDKSLNECLQHYVAQPLGLTRTTSTLDFETESNFAKPYAALEDATPYELKYRQDFRDHFFEAAAGVYTTINDLLTYSAEILKATASISDHNVRTKLSEAETMFSQHIPVLNPSFHERSYALGWIRTQLPGSVGLMGDNLRILPMDELPKIGRGMAASQLVMYHQGATVGYFSSVYLFPETQSAIVVLTNSIALGDTADWIAQLLTQSLFEDSKCVDWVAVTRHTIDRTLQLYQDMASEITRGRQGTPNFSLDDYCGKYYDSTGIFFIEITRHAHDQSKLRLAFQGIEKHAFDLRFFHDEIFEWVLSRNETAMRARYHTFSVDYFLFRFTSSDKEDFSVVQNLTWRHDPNFVDAETSSKR